jgi:hypothetical protein
MGSSYDQFTSMFVEIVVTLLMLMQMFWCFWALVTKPEKPEKDTHVSGIDRVSRWNPSYTMRLTKLEAKHSSLVQKHNALTERLQESFNELVEKHNGLADHVKVELGIGFDWTHKDIESPSVQPNGPLHPLWQKVVANANANWQLEEAMKPE